jgi:hypothetical protein
VLRQRNKWSRPGQEGATSQQSFNKAGALQIVRRWALLGVRTIERVAEREAFYMLLLLCM